MIYAKNNDLPSLPLSIKITGSTEKKWTHASALEDITRSIESELKDKILRFSFNLKDCFSLEWSWQEDKIRGGWECTILAHISTGSSAISVQNKRHLHWRSYTSLMDMNNDIEFAGPGHNLLLKSGPASTKRQVRMNEAANQRASPQAIRKKRFVKLDLSKLEPQRVATSLNFENRQVDQGAQLNSESAQDHYTGSIGQKAALALLIHD